MYNMYLITLLIWHHNHSHLIHPLFHNICRCGGAGAAAAHQADVTADGGGGVWRWGGWGRGAPAAKGDAGPQTGQWSLNNI